MVLLALKRIIFRRIGLLGVSLFNDIKDSHLQGHFNNGIDAKHSAFGCCRNILYISLLKSMFSILQALGEMNKQRPKKAGESVKIKVFECKVIDVMQFSVSNMKMCEEGCGQGE